MQRPSIVSLLASLASVALLAPGCDAPSTTDAGTDTGTADAPIGDTALPDDAPGSDAGDDAAPSCGPCGADHGCLRGVCVATCGADLSAIDAALATDVIPAAHACRAGAGALDVVGTNVYELVSEPGVGGATILRLVQWTFADGAVTATTVAETTYAPVDDPAESIFPGYVTVSDDEVHALFGYTTTRAGFAGGVVDIDVGNVTLEVVNAPGNFDAAFVAGSRYVVNGLGLGALTGQALYLGDATEGALTGTTIVDSMGDSSGSVSLWAEESMLIFSGARFASTWPDGSMGGLTFAVPLADALAASTPIDAYADAEVIEGAPGAFELLTGGRMLEVYYGASGIDGIRMTQLEVDAGAVTVGAPRDVTLDDTFFNAAAIEDDVLLVHGTGVLRATLD